MQLLNININKNRVFGLDILRALAIFFVVFSHGRRLLMQGFDVSWMSYLVFDGVTIFFVLSGFLIGRILIRNFEQDGATIRTLIHFWIRRWFRTLPNYYLILFLILFIHHVFLGIDYEREKQFLFFVQNFYTVHPPFFGEAWSLSVEEWFYLLTPVMLLLLVSMGISFRRSILIIVVLIIIFSNSARIYRVEQDIIQNMTDWSNYIRKQVITRLDSLMFGILAAYFSVYQPKKFFRYRIPLFILGLFMIIGHKLSFILIDEFNQHSIVYIGVFSFTIISIGVMLLLPFMSSVKTGSGILYRSLTRISLISYSMYLINHYLILVLFIPFFRAHVPISNIAFKSVIEYLVFWSATILGSVILYKYWELPMMNIRDRIVKKNNLRPSFSDTI
jgi:peptidoglycan/LPS O-acetylase OafA/YrhL